MERLAGIMEGKDSSIALVERGDLEPIPRHPDFRIFAAMNPATDAGTSRLPPLWPPMAISLMISCSDLATPAMM